MPTSVAPDHLNDAQMAGAQSGNSDLNGCSVYLNEA
jgi:hypothetical protein